MGKAWPDDPESAHTPRRKRVPSYGQGSRMQELMDVLTDPTAFDVADVVALYPHVSAKRCSELVYNANRKLLRNDLVGVERLAHDFIVGPGRPPQNPPAPRQSWWRRFWQSEWCAWLLFAATPAAGLLTAVEVAR